MKKFNIGDRVRVINTFAGKDLRGKTGTVICINENCWGIGIEFDDKIYAGHSCNGIGKNGYCRYSDDLDELELIAKKSFTKSDLQNGDVIKRRNGNIEIVILPLGTLVSKDGYMTLKRIEDDLTNRNGDEDWDIVEVRRPKSEVECQFCAFEHEWGELVYKREEKPKFEVGKYYKLSNNIIRDGILKITEVEGNCARYKIVEGMENDGKSKSFNLESVFADYLTLVEDYKEYYEGKAVCIKSHLPSDLTVGKVYDFSENKGKGRNDEGGYILNKPFDSLEAINAAFSSGIEFIQLVEETKGE